MKKDIFTTMMEGLSGLCKRLESFSTLAAFGRLQEDELANSKTSTAAISYTKEIKDYATNLINTLSQGKSTAYRLLNDDGGDGGKQRAISEELKKAENDITNSLRVTIGIDDKEDQKIALGAVSEALNAIHAIVQIWENIRRIRASKGLQQFDPIKLSSGIVLDPSKPKQFTIEYWLKNVLPQSDIKEFNDKWAYQNSLNNVANYTNKLNNSYTSQLSSLGY